MKKLVVIIAVLSIAITSAVKAQSTVAKREFNNILKAYFDTKNALSKDNVTAAGTGAKALTDYIAAFPVKTLTAAQLAEWKKHTVELKKYTGPIITEKDLKAQRKNFEYVSSAMIKLTKAMNMNNVTVYVQYCPMVKRSWLNEVEAVQNPFYGSKMYDCGEVSETLAKK